MYKEFEAKPMDPDLEATIREVKQEFQNLIVKKKDLVLILGRAFQKTVSKPDSICEEIKNTLKEEIAEKIITTRLIEQVCPDEWKRRTRPKMPENEISSFSNSNSGSNRQEVVMTINSSSEGGTSPSDPLDPITPSNSDSNDEKLGILTRIQTQKIATCPTIRENAEWNFVLSKIWHKYKDHINLGDLAYEFERYGDLRKIDHLILWELNSLIQACMALDANLISLRDQKRSLEEENKRLEQDKNNKMAELWSLEQTRKSNIDKSRDTTSNNLN
jgi:hypothetical protein